MSDSRLDSLRPECRSAASKWLHIVRDDFGLEVRILETLRSPERQRELQAAGKSQIKIGWHNFGLAWDFAVFVEGVYQTGDASGLYTKCGLIGRALGCIWGGDWARLKDFGHLEYHPGVTLEQFMATLPPPPMAA